MWLWVAQVALATTLTVPEDVNVTLGPAVAQTPTTRSVTEGTEHRFGGGWVRLVDGASREELWLDPGWTVRLHEDGTVSGDGVAEITAQREVAVWAESQEPDTIPAAAKASRKLGRRVAGVDVAEPLKAHLLTYGRVVLGTSVVDRTASRVMFEDERFYFRLSEALGLGPESLEVPYFWSLGWGYGRMCGGVTAFGVEKAMRRAVARTDAVGRHPTLGGVLSWAIESADTRKELAALDPALAYWRSQGAPPPVIARYAERIRRKQATGPGAPAPALVATGLDGAQHDLAELEGPIVIDWWGSWCGPCITAIPEMKALQATWGDRVTFLALASESADSKARWRAIVDKHAWREGFVHWMHADPDINTRWSIVKWPSYVVLDGEHRVVRYLSRADAIDGVLEELMGAER